MKMELPYTKDTKPLNPIIKFLIKAMLCSLYSFVWIGAKLKKI